MTDVPPNGAQALPTAPHRPFPLERLLYAIAFAFLAWFVLWILIVVGVIQFAFFAIQGHSNDELRTFSRNLVQYLFDLLGFVTFVRDDRPFPFGPFPHQ